MKVGIYTNINRDINARAALSLINILNEFNLDYYVCDNFDFEDKTKVLPFEKLLNSVDLIVAFGGDGTMLKVVSMMNNNEKPILGVNLGKIGFLTEIVEGELKDAVSRLIENKYSIESRFLLEAECANQKYLSLNEIILCAKENSHISTIKINIDDSYATTVRSDGVIVSTPTGSTAYSMSCNGPILSPNVKAMIVNAICPHSLNSIPMVISDESCVILQSVNDNMKLVVDGVTKFEFNNNNKQVKIKKSTKKAMFIRFGSENFYQKLLQKLSYWGE